MTRAEQETLLTGAACEMNAAAARTIIVQFTVAEAMGLLGTIQLALRHPANRRSISRYMRELARHLELLLAECGPATRRLCALGWDSEADTPTDGGENDNR